MTQTSTLHSSLISAFKAIPEELTQRPQWIVWKKEVRGGKVTKVPYNAYTGNRAESNNPDTWASYERVIETLQKFPKQYDGIGFMFNRDYTGSDLDHCINEQGNIDSWGKEIIDSLATYTEYSPSDTGMHIIARGLLPEKQDEKTGERRRPGTKRGVANAPHPQAAIEMYCEGRFFTFTGKHLEGTPTTIEERQEALRGVTKIT